MQLQKAIDLASTMRPAWKTKRGAWRNPHKINRDHVLRLLGPDRNIKTLKKSDLAAMRSSLQKDGKANSTINQIMSFLNTTLNEMVENEVIDKHPKLRNLPVNNAREVWFTKDNIKEMTTAAREDLDLNEVADAIEFAAFTGCRRGNLLGLEVRDVDLDKDTIHFRNTKGDSYYTVDIHPEIRQLLERKCEGEDPNTKVFEFENRDALIRDFNKVRAHVGLGKELVWHCFRHSFATFLAEAEVPVQLIAACMGHKTLTMSLRYAKTTSKARKSAINRI